jgi:hypothetical protein
MGTAKMQSIRFADAPAQDSARRRRRLPMRAAPEPSLRFDFSTTRSKPILATAQRPSEVISVPVAEFDLKRKLWTIPPERTKNGTEHTVPLSPPALRCWPICDGSPATPQVYPPEIRRARRGRRACLSQVAPRGIVYTPRPPERGRSGGFDLEVCHETQTLRTRPHRRTTRVLSRPPVNGAKGIRPKHA